MSDYINISVPMDQLDVHRALWRELCRARAARGAAFARSLTPEWYKVIDRDTFNIGSGYSCVIAQLARHDMAQFREDIYRALEQRGVELGDDPEYFRDHHGSYEMGLEVLRNNNLVELDDDGDSKTWEDEHGFCIYNPPFEHYTYNGSNGDVAYFTSNDHWAILQEAWMEQIALERATESLLVEV